MIFWTHPIAVDNFRHARVIPDFRGQSMPP
jgi:hypothetical protein